MKFERKYLVDELLDPERQLTMMQVYHMLKEAGAPGDFTLTLQDAMHKELIQAFQAWEHNLPAWCYYSDVSDLKTNHRIMWSEAESLRKKVVGAEIHDSKLSEAEYTIVCEIFKKKFTIEEEVIINDDMNAIKEIPTIQGRSAVRTLCETAVELLEGGGDAYDDEPFFDAAAHNNAATTALTADVDGMAAVLLGINAIRNQLDLGGISKLGLRPKNLIVPTVLYAPAKVLYESPTVLDGAVLVANQVVGLLTPVEEPNLTSDTGWYICCDPQVHRSIEVGFLKGVQVPLLSQVGDPVRDIESPYGFGLSEMSFLIKFCFGVAFADWRSMYQGNV